MELGWSSFNTMPPRISYPYAATVIQLIHSSGRGPPPVKTRNPTTSHHMSDLEAKYDNDNIGGGHNCDIDVHTHIVLIGYASSLVSFLFCIGVVLLPPGPTLGNNNGALRYISEGLEIFCGWSVVVMGTCTMAILMCQLVASAYMRDRHAGMWAVLQAISWNTVAGVTNTGWGAHYIALVIFLVSNLAFNHIACNDSAYGSRVYRVANAAALTFSIVLFAVGLAAMICGIDTTKGATLRSFSVAFEFVVMFSIVLQNVLLVRALDTYHVIHLRFEPR